MNAWQQGLVLALTQVAAQAVQDVLGQEVLQSLELGEVEYVLSGPPAAEDFLDQSGTPMVVRHHGLLKVVLCHEDHVPLGLVSAPPLLNDNHREVGIPLANADQPAANMFLNEPRRLELFVVQDQALCAGEPYDQRHIRGPKWTTHRVMFTIRGERAQASSASSSLRSTSHSELEPLELVLSLWQGKN